MPTCPCGHSALSHRPSHGCTVRVAGGYGGTVECHCQRSPTSFPTNSMLDELTALREVNRIVLDLLSRGCYACGSYTHAEWCEMKPLHEAAKAAAKFTGGK